MKSKVKQVSDTVDNIDYRSEPMTHPEKNDIGKNRADNTHRIRTSRDTHPTIFFIRRPTGVSVVSRHPLIHCASISVVNICLTGIVATGC